MPLRQIQKMGVIPDLEVTFIHFGDFNLARERLLEGAGIRHSQKNIFFGNGRQALEHLLWAIGMFQNVKAQNDIEAVGSESFVGNFGIYQLRWKSLFLGQTNASGVEVSAPHAPSIPGKKRQRLSASAPPVQQRARGAGMAAEQVAGTDFPVLLEKVVSVGPRIDLVGEMLKLCHVTGGGSYCRGG